MRFIKVRMYYIIVLLIIFLSVLIFNIEFVSSKSSDVEEKFLENYNFSSRDIIVDNLEKMENSEIIIIGDSRFEQIINDRKSYEIPQNFTFIAKSAMEVNWFVDVASKKLRYILDNNDEKKYHVVINMGVNDIQFYKNYDESIDTYLNEYKHLISDYRDVDFYLLSINPIVEKKLIKVQPDNIRTSDDIKYFNSRLVHFSIRERITYCDAINKIDFETNDGIHYTKKTNQDIINFILSDCVIIK
ncbi:MAG: SGNH/GDSL hydrolase family protein [Bacilli bacterium]|nr:SGNH/GDSL hydrolase family protein [Bacilli bacterium]